ALYWERSSSFGALAAMFIGGGTTVTLQLLVEELPAGLDANVFGITASAIVFIAGSVMIPDYSEQKVN
ncbi:MAG: sodium:solute symporter family protein, partial [Balneolaceae bacterium]